jgi:hypothetical protein
MMLGSKFPRVAEHLFDGEVMIVHQMATSVNHRLGLYGHSELRDRNTRKERIRVHALSRHRASFAQRAPRKFGWSASISPSIALLRPDGLSCGLNGSG